MPNSAPSRRGDEGRPYLRTSSPRLARTPPGRGRSRRSAGISEGGGEARDGGGEGGLGRGAGPDNQGGRMGTRSGVVTAESFQSQAAGGRAGDEAGLGVACGQFK